MELEFALEPQNSWEVNEPEQLNNVLQVLEKIKCDFNYYN